MATERETLVTSFAELKVTDLVVCKPCGWCGGKHRGLLVKFLADAETETASGEVHRGPVFRMLPVGCRPKPFLLGPAAVGRRVVYLVETGLEASQSVTTKAPRRQVRQGVR